MTKHKLDEHSEIGKISIIQSSIFDGGVGYSLLFFVYIVPEEVISKT